MTDIVNTGDAVDDPNADIIRDAFEKVNAEFLRISQVPAAINGAPGAAGADGRDADVSLLQLKSEKDQAGGYAGLDANLKLLTKYLPPSTATSHHIFATQADMLAGSGIKEGDLVLVHGDPQADNNGEYVALQDAPTLITHYDHLGEHVAAHRHDSDDVDVLIGAHGHTSLTSWANSITTSSDTALQQEGTVDAMGVPFVSLNSGQIAALKANSIYEDDRQKLMFKDNADISHEIISPKHYSGTTDPLDTLGADGDLHFRYTA